jgi:methionyl-tRNA synthetase
MALADRANQYVDHHKPWTLAKDPARLPEVLAIATQGINLFRVLMSYLAPVLPRMAEQAGAFLGCDFRDWEAARVPLLDRALNPYQPLATRLDPAAVKDLVEAPAAAPQQSTPTATIADFHKLDLRVARVLEARAVEGSDKLLQLTLDLGQGRRNVYSGIRANYAPEQLAGRLVLMIANLEPRKMRFGVSEGMVLCAGSDAAGFFLLAPDSGAQPGMQVT